MQFTASSAWLDRVTSDGHVPKASQFTREGANAVARAPSAHDARGHGEICFVC
jgi:hypothetical protein